MACWKVLHHAVERAREGAGPQLVVGKLLRLCGHGEHDDGSYVEKKMKSSDRGRDCLKVMEEEMKKKGHEKEWQDWREEAQREVEQAVAKVSAEPVPDPFEEDWRATQSAGMVEVMVAS
jgi:pyruvate dehydrogenase E1 component alpha subunit/2-oxoisovalerate dehydrogenase E1 component alpha subunit